MSALCITVFAVVAGDQSVKFMLRRLMGTDVFALGSCVSVRVVAGRIWLRRLSRRFSGLTMWCIWLVAAIALIKCSAWAPFNTIFMGLLLGSSLSHAVESSLQGSITDYICLRNGAAFNLADLALAAGAIGILSELFNIAHQRMS